MSAENCRDESAKTMSHSTIFGGCYCKHLSTLQCVWKLHEGRSVGLLRSPWIPVPTIVSGKQEVSSEVSVKRLAEWTHSQMSHGNSTRKKPFRKTHHAQPVLLTHCLPPQPHPPGVHPWGPMSSSGKAEMGPEE